METIKDANITNPMIQFKIDLIVWKLNELRFMSIINTTFKIDLIVWKQEI